LFVLIFLTASPAISPNTVAEKNRLIDNRDRIMFLVYCRFYLAMLSAGSHMIESLPIKSIRSDRPANQNNVAEAFWVKADINPAPANKTVTDYFQVMQWKTIKRGTIRLDSMSSNLPR